jgi:hypothetical protein
MPSYDSIRALIRARGPKAAAQALRRRERMRETEDVEVEDQGSIVLLVPKTGAALRWFEDNVQSASWQWLGGSLAVDGRYARDIVAGLEAEGFLLRGAA